MSAGPEPSCPREDVGVRAPAEPTARLGVLFVHGIGDHREGETLSSFGEPLVDWMQEWLFGDGKKRRGRLRWTEARTRASGNDKERPAYARVELETHGGDPAAPRRDTWLLCEAHWGESVQPPEPFALLRWLWTRGPLVIYWHFYLNGQRRDLGRSSARRETYPLVAVALALTTQLVVGLGLLLLAIPIGAWRAGVLRVVRLMTLTLGDSYVLLERELQRAALVQRVRDALTWLGGRVERIVVVGHSQGAALGHEALAAAPHPERVSLFVTLGSGLEKLNFLKLARWNRYGLLPATLFAPLIVVALCLLVHGVNRVARWEIAVAGALGIAALLSWARLKQTFVSYQQRLELDARELKLRMADEFEWIDVYTRHDIVPMGAASQLAAANVVRPFLAFNVGSYLRDHVRYFAPRAGCLPALWNALLLRTPLHPFSDQERESLIRLALLHCRDVSILVNARIALFVAALGSTIAIHERLAGLGASVIAALDRGPLGDWFKPVVKLRDAARWGFERAGVSGDEALAAAHALFGALAPLGALFLWWVVFRATVTAIGTARWRGVVRTVGDPALRMTKLRNRVTTGVAIAIAYLPVLVALLVYLAPGVLTVSTLNTAVTTAFIWLFLLSGAGLLLSGPWLVSREVFDRDKRWFDRAMTPLFPGILALVFLLLAAWMEGATLSPRERELAASAVLAWYGVQWQLFALHRLRRELWPGWLFAVLVLPAAVAWARFAASPSVDALLEAFYCYVGGVFLVLGAAAYTKNRTAINDAFVKRFRAMRW